MRQRWLCLGLLGLAAFLFVAPWLLDFTDHTIAAWNDWISGILTAIFSLMALADAQSGEEWGILILGAWLVASPWLFDFYQRSEKGTWSAVGIGVVIMTCSIYALRRPQLTRLK